MAVRVFRREETTKDQGKEWVAKAMGEVGLTAKVAEAIYRLTSLCTFEDRFVIQKQPKIFFFRLDYFRTTKMV